MFVVFYFKILNKNTLKKYFKTWIRLNLIKM